MSAIDAPEVVLAPHLAERYGTVRDERVDVWRLPPVHAPDPVDHAAEDEVDEVDDDEPAGPHSAACRGACCRRHR